MLVAFCDAALQARVGGEFGSLAASGPKLMRLCAVSVDLDEIPHYYAIHGLSPPSEAGRNAVYERALPRLHAWAGSLGVPLTLFAVGSDLANGSNADRLAAMARSGHEVANHSQDHLYDLTRKSREEQLCQVDSGASSIERVCGSRPRGFRAPGYTVTDELYDVLSEVGVGYSSSVFPCPAYYFAKLAKLAAIRIRGRQTRSVLDSPVVLRAPTRPYRVGRPYWRSGCGLLEMPIQVTRRLRLPFFGTALTLAGPSGARRLVRGVVGEPLVNLELHGIDVLDAADGFEELRGHQPDAAVPHVRKLEALTAVLQVLRAERYRFVRLDEAARQFV